MAEPPSSPQHGAASPIRERRKLDKLTQAELADAVGVSRQTIVAIEKGDYSPSVFLSIRIARELDATVEELFHLDDDPQKAENPR